MGQDMNPHSQKENVSPRNTKHTYNDYVVEVTEIVLKVARLSSFLPISPAVRDSTVKDWLEILWGKVPLEGLYLSYQEAMSKHKDGPFRPGHIIAAWDARKASLPVVQSQCLFCPRFMEDPSAPQSCVGPCPFHGMTAESLH